MFRSLVVKAATCIAASTLVFGSASSQGAPAAGLESVVVLPFATLSSDPLDDAVLSNHACIAPKGSPALTTADAAAIDAAVQSGLSTQLTTAISREVNQGGPAVYSDLQNTPPGEEIIAGCVVRADPGDPKKRLLGMGMGASVLSVHVQVYRRGETRLELVGEFDAEVQGANKLPPIGPIGLAVHGIRGHGLTLTADIDKLAKLVAKRVLAGQFGS